MVAINTTNTSDLPNSDFPEIPTGDYKVLIKEISEDIHKKVPEKYIKVVLEILEGEFKNQKLWDNWLGLIPHTEGKFAGLSSKMNVEKASQSKFKSLLDSLGIKTINSTDELLNKIVTVSAKNSGGFTNVQSYKNSSGEAVTNSQSNVPAGVANTNNNEPSNSQSQQGNGGAWG